MAAGDAFRPDIPSTARMYDYYLGGKDNYPADREAAEQVIAMMPPGTIRTAATQNRAFLGRAVRYLAAEFGIRQFLDIGTGLPTMNSVHEVAQSIDPGCRVVYVDHDPVVLAHARDLLNGVENATIISHDLRQPEQILGDPELTAMLDPGQPVAVLLVAILHFISDADDPAGLIGRLMNALPAGSCLVVSHATADSFAQLDDAVEVYRSATSRMFNRSRAEVEALFAGLDLIEPGIVWLPQWRPDAHSDPMDDPGRSLCWCGVARKTRPGPPRPAGVPAETSAEPPRQEQPFRPAHSAISAAPPDGPFRPHVPNVARMYDYLLGGKDNYPADRAAVTRTFAVLTAEVVRGTMLQNRRFLKRAVRYLAVDQGIRQFLDIGTGLPTMNNVHEVAQSVTSGARVVYVDNDPVAVAHARDMLNGVPRTTIVKRDARDPGGILSDPCVRSVLDFSQPIGVLLVAILHLIADADDPAGIVAALMDEMPAGSYLVLSHLSADHYRHADKAARGYRDAPEGLRLRSRAEVAKLFGGLPLADPGELVWTAQWHPDADTPPAGSPGGASIWCGVARKD